MKTHRMLITDVVQDHDVLLMQTEKLSEEFGRDLNTIAKARDRRAHV